MIKQIYYIGTGSKSAMYTLRMTRQTDDVNLNKFMPDHYLCNLTTAGDENEDRAIEKAKEYVEAMKARIGETDEFKIEFGGVWDAPAATRRGKLSVRDTSNINTIEAGVFPFGKHVGTKIVDAPDSYVLYFADKLATAHEPVIYTLAAACTSVALERGLFTKREEARAERAAQDAKSNHIGTVGERREFDGEITGTFFKDSYEGGYHINWIRIGDDIVVYNGKLLGDRGDQIRFKATIKRHQEYNGVKSTAVNRPKLLTA